MKCTECKKITPDGFSDCPWCGATSDSRAVQPAQRKTPGAIPPPPLASALQLPTAPSNPGKQSQLLNLSFLSSLVFFLISCDLAINRGPVAGNPAELAYEHGKWVGSLLWGALIVAVFLILRKRKLRNSLKILAVFGTSFSLSLLILSPVLHSRPSQPTPVALHRLGDELKNPKDTNKWTAPGRSFMKDMLAYRQKYVSDVSQLDKTAKPLYTIESFGDAQTVQQMIAQLQARLGVAEKYGDWEPVLSKMEGYVSAVDASEQEKNEFLEGFKSTLPHTRATFKTLKDKERAWLRASQDVYQFALSRSGKYSMQPGNILFQQRGDAESFNQKLTKAQRLNAEFIRAFAELRQKQDAIVEEMGSEGTEYDPRRAQ